MCILIDFYVDVLYVIRQFFSNDRGIPKIEKRKDSKLNPTFNIIHFLIRMEGLISF